MKTLPLILLALAALFTSVPPAEAAAPRCLTECTPRIGIAQRSGTITSPT